MQIAKFKKCLFLFEAAEVSGEAGGEVEVSEAKRKSFEEVKILTNRGQQNNQGNKSNRIFK